MRGVCCNKQYFQYWADVPHGGEEDNVAWFFETPDNIEWYSAHSNSRKNLMNQVRRGRSSLPQGFKKRGARNKNKGTAACTTSDIVHQKEGGLCMSENERDERKICMEIQRQRTFSLRRIRGFGPGGMQNSINPHYLASTDGQGDLPGVHDVLQEDDPMSAQLWRSQSATPSQQTQGTRGRRKRQVESSSSSDDCDCEADQGATPSNTQQHVVVHFPRSGFANPKSKTCYLSALLQSLFCCSDFVNLLQGHKCSNKTHCPWCCLKEAEEISRDAEVSSDISFFAHFFDALPMLSGLATSPAPWNFHGRQHDASDALMTMFTYAPLEKDALWNEWNSSLRELFSINLGQRLETIYDCGCGVMQGYVEEQQQQDVIWNLPVAGHLTVHAGPLQKHSPVLELATSQTGTSLLDIYCQGTANPAVRPPCSRCQTPPRVVNSQSGVPLGGVWIISLKRMEFDTEAQKAVKVSMKIVPNVVIHRPHAKTYHLRSVVVHRGVHTSSGHYVTYVILSQKSTSGKSPRCYLYDDATTPRVLDGLPAEVYTDATLFVYSREPAPAGIELSSSKTLPGKRRVAQHVHMPKPSLNSEPKRSLTAHTERVYCMPVNEGQERVQNDARRLLEIFTASHGNGDKQDSVNSQDPLAAAVKFLKSLPRWLPEAGVPQKLADAPHRYDKFMQALLLDKVTSATAMQTKPFTGDCFLYPFVVLMEASAIAEAIPSTFFESCTMSTMGALLNKRAYIKLARYRSKSRAWCVMTASAGEGKSPGLKPLSAAVAKAMEDDRLAMYCEGVKHDSFHAMQSSTTAAAIHKLRACNGYLWMRAADAGRCLSPNQAVGRPVDASKHTDLEYFLDAAHGDEFYHQTMKTRDAMEAAERATRKANPKKPIPDVPDTNFDHTNVTITFMQQDDYAVKFWACIAEHHKVGLPQRCEFTFGGDCDPAATKHCDFLNLITVPIVSNMIKLLLRTCGPKLPNHVQEDRQFSCSQEQTKIFEELELYMKRNKRNTDSDCLKVSLPKSLYWLGTYAFFNHFLEQFWDLALDGDVWSEINISENISDETFGAAVNAVMRKYMAGQAALAVDVENRSWLPRTQGNDHEVRIPERLLRVLRVCAGARITFEVMLGVIIDWRIIHRETSFGSERFQAMLAEMTELLQTAEKLGLGKLHYDDRGYPYLHKFLYESLGESVRQLLRQCRLPCYNWAVGSMVGVEVQAESCADVELPTMSSPADDASNCGKARASVDRSGGYVTSSEVLNAAAEPTQRTQESASPVDIADQRCQVVFNKVVNNKSGLSMSSAERIAFLRQHASNMNCHGKTRETKVPKASSSIYARTTFTCSGTKERACPYSLEMFHYLQKTRQYALNATIIYQHHEHNHGNEKQNVGTHFTPQQLATLKAFLAERNKATTQELMHVLVDAKCPYNGDSDNLRVWRKNYFERAKTHQDRMPTRFPKQVVEQASTPGRLLDLVEYQKIDEWPRMHATAKHASLCQLQVIPEPLPDANMKLFVSFTTEGMARRFAHFEGDLVGLIVDVKQGVCAEPGFGIATVLGASKDNLRNTTFGTSATGKRVQGKAYTTHGQLLLQALVNVESTPNFVLLFKAACWLWSRCRPGKPRLETLYIVMMKDYARGIENARKAVFGHGHSRPLNDVFHMQRAQGTLETYLRKTTLMPSQRNIAPQSQAKKNRSKAKAATGRLVKTHSSWITSSWITNRRLPTFDLFSALHQGNLDRIEFEFGEKAAAEYLGNASSSVYTVRLPLATLKQDFGIMCWNPNDEAIMTFAYHWSGISNMVHGTDCGNTPVEAANRVHDSFEKQVRNWTMKKQAGADVLKDMQVLYRSDFPRAYDWDDQRIHFTYPPTEDPALLNSQQLIAANRTTALMFWDLQQSGKVICHTEQLTDNLEITAMPVHKDVTMHVPTAQRGIRLLRMHGQELLDTLLEGGLLYESQGIDGIRRNFTRQGRVRDHFVDLAYIVTCRNAEDMAGFRNPTRATFCTCIWYARYCGCEHLKYMTWIATPLNPQPQPSPLEIPLQRKRGRKMDSRMVSEPPPKRRRKAAMNNNSAEPVDDTFQEADPGI